MRRTDEVKIRRVLRRLTTVAIVLALSVVMLGAYTRLTDAGLGCPDWPGCYGRILLPIDSQQRENVQKQFPQAPFEQGKAWTEMLHRYVAGTLGLLIVVLAIYSFRAFRDWRQPRCFFPCFLVFLVMVQALLGMWTVTLKLLPVVVMAHLLGGMLVFAGLCYYRWQLSDCNNRSNTGILRLWTGFGVVMVLLQIALGGWVSSNYAGIACIGFPKCNGVWFPSLHFSEGFNLFSAVGENHQGGLLENSVRITIQFVHRVGAFAVASYVLVLSGYILLSSKGMALRVMALFTMLIILLQFLLGVMNVLYLLPLPVAVAHNGIAALLLASLVSLFYLSRNRTSNAV